MAGVGKPVRTHENKSIADMGSVRLKFALLWLVVGVVAAGCQDHRQNDNPSRTLLLGHRGTGSGVRQGFVENTLPAVSEALKYADGVEQDIQMSTDGTLWIYHDGTLGHLCGFDGGVDSTWMCIPTSPDSAIARMRICREGVQERIYRLEELFELLRSYPQKVVSLDVKGYFDESCIPGRNVSQAYLNLLADRLAALLDKYDMVDRAFVETDYTGLFTRLKSRNTDIRCYLLGYSDLNEKTHRATDHSWDGVSFNFLDSSADKDNVEQLQAAGLGLQLWTLHTMNDFVSADSLRPTTVQIGDIGLLKAIRRSKGQPAD